MRAGMWVQPTSALSQTFNVPQTNNFHIPAISLTVPLIHETAMRRKTVQELESTKEMTGLVEQACLVAKDAAFNLRDFLENSSNMAFIAVQDCEKELDRAERKIDDGI